MLTQKGRRSENVSDTKQGGFCPPVCLLDEDEEVVEHLLGALEGFGGALFSVDGEWRGV